MSSLLSIADFKGKKLNPRLSPFEILLDVAAVAAEKYDRINDNNNDIDEGENGEPNLDSALSPKRAKRLKKAKLLKPTGNRHNNGEPKLMSSAFKIIQNNDDEIVKTTESDEIEATTSEKDFTTVKVMKKKKERQGRKKLKNLVADDDESSAKAETNNGKRKLEDISNEEWIEAMRNKKPKTRKKGNGPNPPPSLPEEFQTEIVKKGGVTRTDSMVTRIIQKRLERTDVSSYHGRISIPCSQVETFGFLRDQEMTRLRREQTIRVPVIHKPRKNGVTLPLTETPIEMRQWNLHKHDEVSHKVNPQYLLRTAWNKVVSEDELQRGDAVQIWAFRNAQDRLCMALVKIDEEDDQSMQVKKNQEKNTRSNSS